MKQLWFGLCLLSLGLISWHYCAMQSIDHRQSEQKVIWHSQSTDQDSISLQAHMTKFDVEENMTAMKP